MNYVSKLARKARCLSRQEAGQTLVEYSLLIALISIALLGVLAAFGGGVNGLYGVIQDAIDALS